METEKIIDLVQSYITKQQTDLYLFAGTIAYATASEFVDTVCKKKAHPSALLYITTPGGDPHAAYRIIRALRAKYSTVKLAIGGPCKSAGTLIAIGAHELLMADTGELGPLDVQLSKPDELVPNSSGLDVFQAVAVATQQAFDAFEQYLMRLIEDSSGSISTKTGAELAQALAVGLFSPVMAQIDPHRLGEVQRAIKIAQAYGEKMGTPNLKPNGLDQLVEQYPAHGFVIDFDETKKLFKTVNRFSDEEQEIFVVFRPLLRHITRQNRSMDIGATFQRQPSQGAKDANAGPTRRRRRGQPDISAGTEPSQTDAATAQGRPPTRRPRRVGVRSRPRQTVGNGRDRTAPQAS